MVYHTAAAALLFCALPALVSSLNAYGHAYSRPNDFTANEYDLIGRKFSIFTVEKDHAASLYGNASAPKPFKTNSIAASRGTARKIKAVNSSVKVLMYWNAALHFDFYECEAEVLPAWIMPNKKANGVPFYNYSVPAFREWWVACAVNAITGSDGLLDGLFLDATPKIAAQDGNTLMEMESLPAKVQPHVLWNNMDEWGAMVDKVREALGPDAILIDNGFYQTKSDGHLAGEDAWVHTGMSYTESMASVGGAGDTASFGMELLLWVASVASRPENAKRILVGHGSISTAAGGAGNVNSKGDGKDDDDDEAFMFGLAKYMLVTRSMANGWFIANNGSYSITGGLLDQPTAPYEGNGVGCGEPVELVKQISSATLSRKFEHGTVVVNLNTSTASISCNTSD